MKSRLITIRDALLQELYRESESVAAFRERLNDVGGVLAERFAQPIDYLINGPIADDAGVPNVSNELIYADRFWRTVGEAD